MALGINGINTNIFAAQAGTVSGEELTKVAGEILSSPKALSFTPSSFNSGILNTGLDVSLFGTNASRDANAIKLAATNNAAMDVSLSNKALSAISSLNAKAASTEISNFAQFRNGLIHINAEKPDFTGLNDTFAPSSKPQIFESMNLSKDRKGSSPFYIPQTSKKDAKKTEGINVLA